MIISQTVRDRTNIAFSNTESRISLKLSPIVQTVLLPSNAMSHVGFHLMQKPVPFLSAVSCIFYLFIYSLKCPSRANTPEHWYISSPDYIAMSSFRELRRHNIIVKLIRGNPDEYKQLYSSGIVESLVSSRKSTRASFPVGNRREPRFQSEIVESLVSSRKSSRVSFTVRCTTTPAFLIRHAVSFDSLFQYIIIRVRQGKL